MALTLNYKFADDKSLSARVGPALTISRASDRTIVNSSGLIESISSNVAGFQHDKDGATLGLLVEEARTNRALHSENFNTSWTLTNAVVTTNSTTSPDGTLTADTLGDDNGGAGLRQVHAARPFAIPADTDHTFSVYAKADQLSRLALRTNLYSAGNGASYFDLSSGSTGTLAAGHDASGIEDVGNGWYRCWVTFNPTNPDSGGTGYIHVVDSDGSLDVNDDGTSSIFIWGAQFETGTFPTSYIQTAGSTVTRNADTLNSTDVSWYNDEAGTFYCDALPYYVGYSIIFFEIGGAISDRFGFAGQVDSALDCVHLTDIGDDCNLEGSADDISDGTRFHAAAGIAPDDAVFYLDGSLIATDITVDMPASNAFDELSVGSSSQLAGRYLNGVIKELAYWDERLDDSYIEGLSDGSIPIGGGGRNFIAVSRAQITRGRVRLNLPRSRKSLRGKFE